MSVSPLETLPRYMRKSLARILIIFSHYRLSRLCWDVLDVSATSWSLLWQLKTGPKNKILTHFNKRQTLIVTQLSHLQNASLAGVPDLQSVAFAKSGSRKDNMHDALSTGYNRNHSGVMLTFVHHLKHL